MEEKIYVFRDKDKIMPIFIQTLFLKKCSEQDFNKPILFEKIIREVLDECCLSSIPSAEGKDYLFNTSLALTNLTYLSIYLIENDNKILEFYNERLSEYDNKNLYQEVKNQKILVDGEEKMTLFEFLQKIRNSFAHNNYNIYPNGTIEIFNQKFETKLIPYDETTTIKDIRKLLKDNYDGYEIKEIRGNNIVLKNYSNHIDDYSFRLNMSVGFLNEILGELMEIIINYFIEIDRSKIDKRSI